jgi:hypothetical protein
MRQTLKLVKLKKSMQIIIDLYSFLAEYPLEEKLSKEVEFSKIQRRQLSQFVKYYLPEKYKWPKI